MTNYFRYHLHIDRHQKIDGEWSVKQVHFFDTTDLFDRFNRIDPTQPTMIHIVGEHLFTFSHPVSDLALYLADIYGTFDNMLQNVTIILDEPNELAFEDFKYEFDHVQFNDQAYQSLENRLKKEGKLHEQETIMD